MGIRSAWTGNVFAKTARVRTPTEFVCPVRAVVVRKRQVIRVAFLIAAGTRLVTVTTGVSAGRVTVLQVFPRPAKRLMRALLILADLASIWDAMKTGALRNVSTAIVFAQLATVQKIMVLVMAFAG